MYWKRLVVVLKKQKNGREPFHRESQLAKMLDIPMQVLPQVFHLDMSGNREAVIVGCESIREYALGCITIGAGKLAVQFCGDALQIRNMNEGTIVIEGEIHTIHFETVEQPTQR